MNRKKLCALCGFIMLCAVLLMGCAGTSKEENKKPAEGGIENPVLDMVEESGKELAVGDAAPDFTAKTADGSSFTLSAQEGKVVLLNFWATWCSPCVGEMPAFEKLHAEYGDQAAVLAINCMEDEKTVDRFLTDAGYTFPVAYDTQGEISGKYPTDGIPYTLVIGKDGTIKNVYVGAGDADAQYKVYKDAIDKALEE